MNDKHLPVYSLDEFRTTATMGKLYQVEVFDANRHFQVSYPHRHDFYEILFLQRGSGFHIIDANKYEIKPPCVFFLSPGQAHKLELSHDVEGYIYLFNADFYLSNQKNKNRLLEYPFFFSVEQKNPPIYIENKEDAFFLGSLFQRASNEIGEGSDAAEEIVKSILDLILLTSDKLYPEELRSMNKGKGHTLVKNFLLLIEENYQKNLRVNDYAEMLAITANHLTQMVRQVTGKTSVELLQEKVIGEVKRLLLHTNMNVSEIAELLNFPDQSYFSKYFKKVAGESPLEFRQKNT